MAQVRCYAGSTYPERPESLEWEGTEKSVAEILHRWRTPETLGFRVRTIDGMTFDLIYDLRSDQWTVIPRMAPKPG
ncbi:hypothetical protein [Thermoflexus sp.]|uniref:hypothetical protein n=2 Tax=Thermoflexus sp. TaxID=1969742 RepID=UPI0025CBB5F3|nr:hypothetical protein [Thermoflexus sp.]MCS6962602.1 hypothetical protein [Thermoflexus sp.]MCX7690186.1 hypothetical protein [Thermoflexus sp.]MDW8064068.1 hypothetical protein [Anaerolineae bacterium]MDW8183738.1 hypothetical protein [Anaerolineae bacterium]